jgi:hypothetical protein
MLLPAVTLQAHREALYVSPEHAFEHSRTCARGDLPRRSRSPFSTVPIASWITTAVLHVAVLYPVDNCQLLVDLLLFSQ